MLYARYRKTRLDKSGSKVVVDERWAAIDAKKSKAAMKRAQEAHLPEDRYLAEDAKLEIEIFDEQDLLDTFDCKVFMIEPVGNQEPNVREAAMAETLNLLREALNDRANRLAVQTETGTKEVIEIEKLLDALNSGHSGDAYLSTDGSFENERDNIVATLFGLPLVKNA